MSGTYYGMDAGIRRHQLESRAMEFDWNSTDVQLAGRIAFGALMGYCIGWEREWRGSKAGNRTFALVALSAAAFTAIGDAYFPATAEKIMAGIVSGVGFLGAGLIFKSEDGVFGLTTAASLWAVAALGAIAGTGHLMLSLSIMLLSVFVLEVENIPLLKHFDAVTHGRDKTPTIDSHDET